VETVTMMKVFNYETVKLENVKESGASNVKVRWLITKDMGAPTFAMRLFEVSEGGCSPLHTHPWEHEVFILEGEGVLFDGKKETHFKPNDVVYVALNEWHQFKNTGSQALKFLCLIPHPKK
jgi:quercetin dioxygenase-like cupin family protein